MPMTIVVTANVADRYRGFLASCMLEIAPGVYTAPRMTTGVRERVWSVIAAWWGKRSGSYIVMTWPDAHSPGGQAVRALGVPLKSLIEYNDVHLVFRSDPTTSESP